MVGLEEILKIIWFQPPCHEQGHLPPDQSAQSSIQPGLEPCQGGSKLPVTLTLHIYAGNTHPGPHSQREGPPPPCQSRASHPTPSSRHKGLRSKERNPPQHLATGPSHDSGNKKPCFRTQLPFLTALPANPQQGQHGSSRHARCRRGPEVFSHGAIDLHTQKNQNQSSC